MDLHGPTGMDGSIEGYIRIYRPEGFQNCGPSLCPFYSSPPCPFASRCPIVRIIAIFYLLRVGWF